MDRLNKRHVDSRVDLAVSVGHTNAIEPEISFRRTFSPAACFCIGVLSFVGCSLAVITTAGLIALQIR